MEITYERDLDTREQLETELLRHADRLATRLRRHGVAARTVQLKVRFADFTTVTRSLTAPEPVATAHDLLAAGRALLDRAGIRGRAVRLLGLGGDGLVNASEPRQLGLDPDAWADVEQAVPIVRWNHFLQRTDVSTKGRDSPLSLGEVPGVDDGFIVSQNVCRTATGVGVYQATLSTLHNAIVLAVTERCTAKVLRVGRLSVLFAHRTWETNGCVVRTT